MGMSRQCVGDILSQLYGGHWAMPANPFFVDVQNGTDKAMVWG